jgi:2'-5' RNA ligase
VRYGPTLREPRLIWAEGESPDQLFVAKHAIERALSRNAAERPFRLHLTVARFDPARFPKFSEQNIRDAVSWTEEAKTFVLMESHRTPSGADYTVLGEFRL